MSVVDKREGQLVHPQKFIVWLFIVSIVMAFAGLTSAHLLRKGEGNWLEFDLPFQFVISTIVIVVSSITGHIAYLATNKESFNSAKLFAFITFILGIVFLVTQLKAWDELQANNVYFGGELSNPSGSFLYVFSGLHGAHIVIGLFFLLYVLWVLISKKIGVQKKKDRVSMGMTFWHFLDALWLCLYVFLIFNH